MIYSFTFHYSQNYGAFLQAYVLQRKVEYDSRRLADLFGALVREGSFESGLKFAFGEGV